MLSINLSKIYHYSSEKTPGMLGIKPGAAGREARMLPLRYAAPPPPSHVNVSSKNLKESDSKELLGKGANS